MLSHFVTIITVTFNIVNFITIIISSILDLNCTKRRQTIIMSETFFFLFFSPSDSFSGGHHVDGSKHHGSDCMKCKPNGLSFEKLTAVGKTFLKVGTRSVSSIAA